VIDRFSEESYAQARMIVAVLNGQAAMGAFDRDYGPKIGRQRADADETIALALQLEQMRASVYETLYPDLKCREMFPVQGDIDPGAQTFAWSESDVRGKFAAIADNGGFVGDLTPVGVEESKQTRPIVSYGGIAHYSLQDLRRAAFMSKPLESRLLAGLRRAWEEKLDDVVSLGDPAQGIATGALNRPIGTGATQTRETAVTTADWAEATKSATAMLDDLMQLVREFVVDSREIQALSPDSLALPVHIYMRAATTYFTDVQGGTVLNRFIQDNGFVRNVYRWDNLKASFTGNASGRALLWKKDPDICSVVIPQDFEVIAPQQHMFGFQVPAHGRTAGFVVYRPLGLRYLTGLPAT
jgi:hypothetical protein